LSVAIHRGEYPSKPGSSDDDGVQQLIVASEALSEGSLTRRDLARRHTKLFRNVYSRQDAELTAVELAVAAWLWSGRRATVAGLSAAALLGSRWLPDGVPAELVGTHRRSPPGIVIHTGSVGDDEVRMIRGIRCTTAERTAYDLGRRLPFTEGLIRVEALMNATGIPVGAIADIAQRYPGARNIRRLRHVLELADNGAESPQETRVRLILIRGGLPRPVTQIRVGSRRLDMGWPEWKVGVEYDGAQHWTDELQHAGHIDRLDYFAGLGWRIVRASAVHLRRDPQGIVCRAAEALRAAGAPLVAENPLVRGPSRSSRTPTGFSAN
jgi:very-short-patch-repair endonuclease